MLGDEDESLLKLALKAGFALALPHSYQSSWNAGPCCGEAKEQGIPDVDFIGGVAKELKQTYSRLYLGGYSNGGDSVN